MNNFVVGEKLSRLKIDEKECRETESDAASPGYILYTQVDAFVRARACLHGGEGLGRRRRRRRGRRIRVYASTRVHARDGKSDVPRTCADAPYRSAVSRAAYKFATHARV